MRYELHLTAFDVLDEVYVSASCYETPDDPSAPIARVWANSETAPLEDCTTATDWIREALLVMLEAL
jgi:hypothetical protein